MAVLFAGVGGWHHDTMYVLRRLARRTLYAGCISGVLGLTIGAGAVVFTWTNALVLDPLKVPAPNELVTVQRSVLDNGVVERRTTMTWLQVMRSLEVGALDGAAVTTAAADLLSQRVVVETSTQEILSVPVRFVSSNYLDVLRTPVVAGRSFRRDDDVPGAAPVAIVTPAFWRQRFAVPGDAVGSRIVLNGVAGTVVGVTGAKFPRLELDAPVPAMLLPLRSAPIVGRNSVAAADPDVKLAEAEPSWRAVAPAATFRLVARLPEQRDHIQTELVGRLRSDEWQLVPLADTLLPFESRAELNGFLALLVLAVGITMILGAGHVVMLVAGEIERRRGEFATRMQIGARRRHLVRLVALEACVLAVLTVPVTWGVAVAISKAASTGALPGSVAIESVGGVSAETAWFAGTALAAVILLLLVPCLRSAAISSPQARIRTRRGAPVGRKTFALLSVGQVSACVVLVVVAGVFVREVAESLQTSWGFEPRNLTQVVVGLGPNHREANALNHAEGMLEYARTIPGVQSAAIGRAPLLAEADDTIADIHVDGRPVTLNDPLDLLYVSSGYFRTIGQRGLRGRTFSAEDRSDRGLGLVTIVSEAAARRLWPGVDPIGRRVRLDRFVFPIEPEQGPGWCRFEPGSPTPVCSVPVRVAEATVVGVVPDVVSERLGESPRGAVYLTLSQWRRYAGRLSVLGTVPVVVRASSAQAASVFRSLDEEAGRRGMTLEAVRDVAAARDLAVAPQRLARALLVLLAAAALVVTVTGTYAATHLLVVHEYRTNAIRLALGATAHRLVRATVLWVASTFMAGIVVGWFGLWWLRPLVGALGVATTPGLQWTLLASAAILLVGVAAAYIPSRRLYAFEPATLLRGGP